MPAWNVVELIGVAAVAQEAQRTGLLAAVLAGPPATAEALAAKLGLAPHATRQVLDVLCALDLASLGPDGYGASDGLRDFDRTSPGGLAEASRLFAQLPAWLGQGTRGGKMDGDLGDRQAAYATVVPALAKMFTPAARRLAAALPVAAGPILDAGAGSGVWSLEQALVAPGVRVTALDLPDVLPAFRAHAEALGLANRVDELAGSYHDAALPEGRYARIVAANVLHLETPAAAAALVARLKAALRPGGELVVIGALAEGTPARDLARTVYDLHLTLRTAQGASHSRAAIEGWAREAGFTACELVPIDLPPNAIAALVCRAG